MRKQYVLRCSTTKNQVRRIHAVACRQPGANSRAIREIRGEAVPAVGDLSGATAVRGSARAQQHDHRFTRKTTRISPPARTPRIVRVSSMLFVVEQQKTKSVESAPSPVVNPEQIRVLFVKSAVKQFRRLAICPLPLRRQTVQRRIATRHTHHINSGCSGKRIHNPAMYPADASAVRA